MPNSPTSVETPLEYLTVESYQWPTPTRAKRVRMEEEMRKLRHRENQKRFMQRKQARLQQLRQKLIWTKMQYKYLQALQEEKMLRAEQQRLHQIQAEQILKDTLPTPPLFEPLDVLAYDVPAELDSIVSDVLLSL